MVHLNADVGEGVDNEELLMPFLSACSIACGGHAGDEDSMTKVIALAIKNKVEIGAHPSYPDTANFGRKTIDISTEELQLSIQSQIRSLEKIVQSFNVDLDHIKPHGALYNDVAINEKRATEFLNAIISYKPHIKLFVPYQSAIATEAKYMGFKIVYEGFADRNYNEDLTLVSRKRPDAVITDLDLIENHVRRMLVDHVVETTTGKTPLIKVDTICVHSDTKHSPKILERLNAIFNN